MKGIATRIIAAFGFLALAGAVHAAPVTFVFQNPGADLPVSGNFTTGGSCNGISISGADLCTVDDALGFDYSKDWASLNATAYNSAGVTSLVQDLSPDNSGLAVLTAGETSDDDQVQVENGEFIVLDFGFEVELLAIDFNAGADVNCATPGDEGPCGFFDLVVDAGAATEYAATDDRAFGGIFGTRFEIAHTRPADGGFTIGSITVDRVDAPEPGILALLGLGLVGVAARRGRKA